MPDPRILSLDNKCRMGIFILFLTGCSLLVAGGLLGFSHYLYSDMAGVPVNSAWVVASIFFTSAGGFLVVLAPLTHMIWMRYARKQDKSGV